MSVRTAGAYICADGSIVCGHGFVLNFLPLSKPAAEVFYRPGTSITA